MYAYHACMYVQVLQTYTCRLAVKSAQGCSSSASLSCCQTTDLINRNTYNHIINVRSTFRQSEHTICYGLCSASLGSGGEILKMIIQPSGNTWCYRWSTILGEELVVHCCSPYEVLAELPSRLPALHAPKNVIHTVMHLSATRYYSAVAVQLLAAFKELPRQRFLSAQTHNSWTFPNTEKNIMEFGFSGPAIHTQHMSWLSKRS